MNRRLSSIAVGLVAAGSVAVSLSSCNAPSCGPGTVQQQQTDGTLKCVAVDVPMQLTPCDTDGGNAVIVGGKCVVGDSVRSEHDDERKWHLRRHERRGTATCHTPTPGTICVSGAILDFKTKTTNDDRHRCTSSSTIRSRSSWVARRSPPPISLPTAAATSSRTSAVSARASSSSC